MDDGSVLLGLLTAILSEAAAAWFAALPDAASVAVSFKGAADVPASVEQVSAQDVAASYLYGN